MIHDPELIEQLGKFKQINFASDVFRATRKNLDPTAPSTSGGRWMPKGEFAALYTSLSREGALAEISYHWNQLTPKPSKQVLIHRLAVSADKTIRLLQGDLENLGIDPVLSRARNYARTQQIGAVVGFLGRDGLIVPSARWACENAILFPDNLDIRHVLKVMESEEVDWQAWLATNGAQIID